MNTGLVKFLRGLNISLPSTKSPEVPPANLSPLQVYPVTNIQWDAESRPSEHSKSSPSTSGAPEEGNNTTQLGKFVLPC